MEGEAQQINENLSQMVSINEAIPYKEIILYTGICLLVFWLLVAFLTARDAYLRFNKLYWGIFWFIVVFFLPILGLIMYLLVRPDDYDISRAFEGGQGGLNIPVANFTGKKGEVLMSFQLKVNSMPLAESVRDMRLDIDWESRDPNKRLTPEAIDKETKEVELKLNRLKLIYDSLKNKLDQENKRNKTNEDKKKQIPKNKKQNQDNHKDHKHNHQKNNKSNKNISVQKKKNNNKSGNINELKTKVNQVFQDKKKKYGNKEKKSVNNHKTNKETDKKIKSASQLKQKNNKLDKNDNNDKKISDNNEKEIEI